MGELKVEELISVIVPVYNVEKYLDKCLESLVNQTYRNLEILLIDDGSTDHSGEKCDAWVKKDTRIQVLHKKNEGVSEARNIGLEVAKGKYIGFVDSDDYIEKNMYEILCKEMQKNKAELVTCGANFIRNEEEIHPINSEMYTTEKVDKFQAIQRFYPLNGSIWKCLLVKERLKDIRFNTNLSIGEDLNFICQYLLNCKEACVFISAPFYNYVIRENSATTVNHSKKQRLSYHMDTIETINLAKAFILQNCEDRDTLSEIEKNTIDVYWIVLYSILNEKLITNRTLIQKYCDEMKEYKKYYSKKDKFYMTLLTIHPKLFEVTYKTVKKMRRKR